MSTEDDQWKLIAGADPDPSNNLYMFDDGDVGNYIQNGQQCFNGELPCCQDSTQQTTSGYGDGSWSFCAEGCGPGMTRQSNCPGTPEGLLAMGSDDRGNDVNVDGGGTLPSGDFGECSYRTDWGWVVRAMWVTPAAAAGDETTFVWTDGSPL